MTNDSANGKLNGDDTRERRREFALDAADGRRRGRARAGAEEDERRARARGHSINVGKHGQGYQNKHQGVEFDEQRRRFREQSERRGRGRGEDATTRRLDGGDGGRDIASSAFGATANANGGHVNAHVGHAAYSSLGNVRESGIGRRVAEDASRAATADARGETRRVWLGRHVFDVNARYEPIKTIGKGAYGVVCSAHDRESGKRVAIKKLANCFDSTIEARRALRELHLLRKLTHDNIIGLVDVMMPLNENGERNDVYLVYELMDTDLHQIIRSKQELLDEHCQYFVYQILRGLKYVHSAQVLHRDLKPANLLLNANCDLKICDFGLARSAVERGRMMTAYVVTRWYRAPELLLNSEEYAAAIDMWSVGCVLAEILGRKPLFPGKDFIHQMRLIIETLGSPEEHDMNFMTSTYARRYISSLPRKSKLDFAQLYPNANPLAIDLLEKMLVFNPERRINVVDALAHPYLASLHDPAMEPTHAHDPYDPFFNLKSFDEPDAHIPDEHLRQAIYQQFMSFQALKAPRPSVNAAAAPPAIPR